MYQTCVASYDFKAHMLCKSSLLWADTYVQRDIVSQSGILNQNKRNEKTKENNRLAVNLSDVVTVQRPLTWSPVGPWSHSSPLICIHVCQSPHCLIHSPSSLPETSLHKMNTKVLLLICGHSFPETASAVYSVNLSILALACFEHVVTFLNGLSGNPTVRSKRLCPSAKNKIWGTEKLDKATCLKPIHFGCCYSHIEVFKEWSVILFRAPFIRWENGEALICYPCFLQHACLFETFFSFSWVQTTSIKKSIFESRSEH